MGIETAQAHIAHQRREGCGQQGHRGILGKGLLLDAGIDPGAQDDGPNVDNVLAKEGKARHEPHLCDGEAVERAPGEKEDGGADEGHQGGVDEGRPRPGNGDIVGDEHILGVDDLPQARENVGRVIEDESRQHQSQYIRQDHKIHAFVSHLEVPPFWLRSWGQTARKKSLVSCALRMTSSRRASNEGNFRSPRSFL